MSACPHAITINGLESKFPETTGVFHEVTGTLIEGRKVYKNSADWYLYYYYYAWGTMVMFEHWRIGPSITGPNYHLDALVMSQQTHMVCPTDAQALGMEWKVKVTRKRSSNWEDAGITVTSVSPGPLAVRVPPPPPCPRDGGRRAHMNGGPH